MLATIYPIGDKTWMHPIPILGQQVLATAVLGGRPVSIVSFVLAAATTTLVAVALVRMTTLLFSREAIIFSR